MRRHQKRSQPLLCSAVAMSAIAVTSPTPPYGKRVVRKGESRRRVRAGAASARESFTYYYPLGEQACCGTRTACGSRADGGRALEVGPSRCPRIHCWCSTPWISARSSEVCTERGNERTGTIGPDEQKSEYACHEGKCREGICDCGSGTSIGPRLRLSRGFGSEILPRSSRVRAAFAPPDPSGHLPRSEAGGLNYRPTCPIWRQARPMDTRTRAAEAPMRRTGAGSLVFRAVVKLAGVTVGIAPLQAPGFII